MIEIKVLVTPETHALLKEAQKDVGIASQSVAVGAYLLDTVGADKVEGITRKMFAGLPGVMVMLKMDRSKAGAVSKRKAAPKKAPARKAPGKAPGRKVAPKKTA